MPGTSEPDAASILATVTHIVSRRSREPQANRAPGGHFLALRQGELFNYIIQVYLDGRASGASPEKIAQTLSEKEIAKKFFNVRVRVGDKRNAIVRVTSMGIRQGLERYYFQHPEEDVKIQIPVADSHAGRAAGYVPIISWRLSESAHRRCEQAMAARDRRTNSNFAQAVDLLRSVLQEHPKDAPTKARLAEIYALQAMHGVTPPALAGGGLNEARRLAEEALSTTKNLWPAHIAMGAVLLCFYQWKEAGQHFSEALRLESDHTRLQVWYFFFLAVHGKLREAIQDFREAASTENVSANIRRNIGLALLLDGDYQGAENQLEHLLRIGSTHFLFHIFLGIAYHARGKFARALEQLHKAKKMPESDHMATGMWLLILAHSDRTRAERSLRTLVAEQHAGNAPYVGWTQRAIAYIGLGRKSEAIKCLEAAFESNDPLILLIRQWPAMRVLHNEPAFQALVKRLKFP